MGVGRWKNEEIWLKMNTRQKITAAYAYYEPQNEVFFKIRSG